MFHIGIGNKGKARGCYKFQDEQVVISVGKMTQGNRRGQLKDSISSVDRFL